MPFHIASRDRQTHLSSVFILYFKLFVAFSYYFDTYVDCAAYCLLYPEDFILYIFFYILLVLSIAIFSKDCCTDLSNFALVLHCPVNLTPFYQSFFNLNYNLLFFKKYLYFFLKSFFLF